MNLHVFEPVAGRAPVVPGRRPSRCCPHYIANPQGGTFVCTRHRGHSGRCAAIWWRGALPTGQVRAVWGEKFASRKAVTA